MRFATVDARLRRIEREAGVGLDPRTLNDAQLDAAIAATYRNLTRDHGSLPAAISALRAAGEIELAQLIHEDISGALGHVGHG